MVIDGNRKVAVDDDGEVAMAIIGGGQRVGSDEKLKVDEVFFFQKTWIK